MVLLFELVMMFLRCNRNSQEPTSNIPLPAPFLNLSLNRILKNARTHTRSTFDVNPHFEISLRTKKPTFLLQIVMRGSQPSALISKIEDSPAFLVVDVTKTAIVYIYVARALE